MLTDFLLIAPQPLKKGILYLLVNIVLIKTRQNRKRRFSPYFLYKGCLYKRILQLSYAMHKLYMYKFYSEQRNKRFFTV